MMAGKIENRKGHFYFGGWDTSELAEKFGTPLYVLSEDVLRARCRTIREDFLNQWENTAAVYAGKASLPLAMVRIIHSEGLGIDLVSGGELYTARMASFPLDRAILHGNSKTREELEAALDGGVGRIVVDSLSELETLEKIAEEKDKEAAILLRVSPGVDPHTHKYILTGHTGSKFGFPLLGNSLREAVVRAMKSEKITLKGFHFHIGSQIFENTSHVRAVEIMVRTMADFCKDLGLVTEELNMGGGFGVDFTSEGRTPSIRS
ncbi:MAG: diaminopimelate decarboxylase, partial [Synergistaceae bacterium]|nr:diaminopimelate decarboxylase [Synergistaceae bacterium]